MIAFILFAIITKLVAVFGKDTAPWIKSTETNSLGSLTFRLELFKQRLDVLESLFWQISDPKHEKFRQYLTKNEIFDIIAPPADAVTSISNWLTGIIYYKLNCL